MFSLSVRKALIISAVLSVLLFASLLFLLKKAQEEFQQIYSVEFPLLQTVSTSVRLMDQSKDLLNMTVMGDWPNPDIISEYASVKEALIQSLDDVEVYRKQSNLKDLETDVVGVKKALDSDEVLLDFLKNAEVIDARKEFSKNLSPKLEKARESLAQVAFLLSTKNEKKLEENRLKFYSYSLITSIGLLVAAFLWFHIFLMYRKSVAARAVAEKELEDQRARNIHSSKLSALGEMAGGVAHEINTPLATIRMTAENCEYILKQGNLKKEVMEQSLSRIVKTVDRIAKIVLSLKTFSRDGSNDKFEKISAKTIMDEVLNFSSERFKSNEVDVQCDVDDINIYCQQIQIEQVLLNLLNNAFDAVQDVDQKWIKISAKAAGNSLKVCVIDSGKKISPEVETKMMSPFFTTKDIGKGTGLGLSVSLGIAKRHGGNLYYESQERHTCFVLILPLNGSENLTA